MGRAHMLEGIEELEEIIRRSPAICFVWRAAPGWPVDYVSDNILQLGYSREEFLSGQRVYESIMHPDDLERVRNEVRRYTDEGKDEFAQEYRLLTRDGQVRWIDDRTWVRRDESGSLTHYQGIVLDITRRKEAQAQATEAREGLERNLRFTESLLLAIPTPVFFKDAEGRYIGCNSAFSEFMGVTAEQIRGKTVFECWPGEHARVYHERDLELIRNPVPQRYEFKVRDCHGVDHPVIYAKRAFFDEADRVAGIVGAFVDITDRTRAEAELRRRIEFERVVTDISTHFVGCHPDELDSAIHMALRKLGELTGVDRCYVFLLREHASTMDNTHEWCAEGIEPHRERLQGIATQDFPSVTQNVLRGRAAQVDRVSELPEGSAERAEFELEGIRSLLLLPVCYSRSVIGFWGLDSVRSERSWSEDDVALLRVVGEIFANGLERRRAEEQLGEALRLESIGRLAAGVAHDFNNMLTPILGYSELLLARMGADPAASAQLLQIAKAARRSRDLVRQLLAFSRKQMLNLEPLDLRVIAESMWAMLRRTIRENIQIRVQTPPERCLVEADAGQLELILMNLALNAQDAMPAGGTLLIETRRLELDPSYCDRHPGTKPGAHVLLCVSDTGKGMDERTRERAFEPFFTTKRTGEGTGLGLSTAYGIVKQHNGAIWLESEPGKGTSVNILLPAIKDSPADAGASRSCLVPERPPEGTTVMVAEDEPIVRSLVEAMLEALGCTVLSAPGGKQCLLLLERHHGPLHLLLTDVVMPDMNGRELYLHVRQRLAEQGRAPVKVLYMSGYTQSVIAHHGILDAGVGFLQKPFTAEQLAAKICEVLAG